MKVQITSRDEQRTSFVEGLYKSLKCETASVIKEKNALMTKAASYIDDGLDFDDAIELMIIETGLSREASKGYIQMAIDTNEEESTEGLEEYSFQFEDAYGKIWSSFDIGKTVFASDEEDARSKSEELLDNNYLQLEAERIVSINKLG